MLAIKSSGIFLYLSPTPGLVTRKDLVWSVFLSVTRQDICCLAQFMKWAVMQEILKFLHIIAQFMNWALRVSCYFPFHVLGNNVAQFMNWTIAQIGRNIYIV